MSVLVIKNPAGTQLTNITSIAVVGGIAFGTCHLQLATLQFDRATMARASGFGSYYVTATQQEIYEQYCRLDSRRREQIERLESPIIKRVSGITVGLSSGGSLDAITDVLHGPIGRGIDLLQNRIRRPLLNFIRNRVLNLADIGRDYAITVADQQFELTTGVSGGMFSSIDGGILRGANGYSNFGLDVNAIRNLNVAIIQVGGGLIVGAGVNLLVIGNFRSFRSMISSFRSLGDSIFTTSVDDQLLLYLGNVFSHAQCYAVVGDAAVGAILPGVDLNIIAS